MRNLPIFCSYSLAVWIAASTVLSAHVAQGQQPAVPAQPSATPPASAASTSAPPVKEETPRAAAENEAELGAFDLEQTLSQGATGMSAEQAAKLALQNGPSIDSARAAQQKAEAGAAGALLSVYPKLDLTARYTRLSKVKAGSVFSGDSEAAPPVPEPESAFDAYVGAAFGQLSTYSFPQYLDQFALRAALSYPVSDLFFAILPGYKAAKGFSEAASWSVKTEQQKLIQQAREAYYNYARARASLVVARAALAQVEAHRKDIVAMVDAGTLAKVELMRIDAQAAAAKVAIARAQGGVAMARTGLSVLIGRTITEDFAISEQLLHPLPPLSESKEQLVAQASERRPEVQALRALANAHQLSAQANGGARLPHLALQAGVDYNNPNARIFPSEDKFNATWDISAVLTWSPNSLFDANSKVSGAEADLAKARADLESLEQGLTIEVAQAYEQYVSAQAAREAAESGIAAAEESYRVRREQFRAGAAVATEVLDAEAGLRNARLELINAAVDLRIARVRLDHAIGKEP